MKYIVVIIAIVVAVFWYKSDDRIHAPKIGSTRAGNYAYLDSSYKSSNTVLLYATSWCGYCKKARQFFRDNKIRYVEYDIEKDRAALERFQSFRGRGIPLIVANSTVIRGYIDDELRKIASDQHYKL